VGVTSPRENLKVESEAPGGGRGGGAGGRGGAAQTPWPVDLRLNGARLKRFDVPATPPEISKLIVGGPYEPAGRGDTPSRRKIFVCRPGSVDGGRARSREEQARARRGPTRLARGAVRGPVA